MSIEPDSHMPVTLPTGVHLRGSTFHLRIGIPDDIRHLWPRRKDGSEAIDAFRASLRTSDRNEAAAKAHRIIAEHHERFDQLRAEAAPKAVPLTPAMAAHLVREVERHLLSADDVLTVTENGHKIARAEAGVVRAGHADDETELTQRQAVAEVVAQNLAEMMALGDLSYAEDFARDELRELGVTVDLRTTPARMALLRVQRAAIAAWRALAARASGEAIPTPEPLPVTVETPTETRPGTPAPSQTLRDVLPLWIARTKAKPNAIGRMERALGLFEEAVGTVPLAELNKAHGAVFVRFLSDTEARGFGAKTAKNHAAAINALLNVAEREDLIKRNPFDLTMDASAGSQQRDAWTSEELDAMFAHRLFDAKTDLQEFPRWRDVAAEDGRALLLLLLHTGARIGELAQLRGEDFTVRNGLTCVRITAEAGTVKTSASERVVPLAAHLMSNPWFAEWASRAMNANGPALPSMHGRKTTPGDIAGRWFRQFRVDARLPDGGLNGAHKFRHWLRTALAEQHVAVEVADQITGHAAKGSAGRVVYTGKVSLAVLKEALDRVRFPAIPSGAPMSTPQENPRHP